MANLGYVLKRLMHMHYGVMLKKINGIHKKTGKSRIAIFRDMKDCAVKYGAGYMDYDLFEMYNLTDEQRDTYLTRGRNDALVKKYNDQNFIHFFCGFAGCIDSVYSCMEKEMVGKIKSKSEIE